MFVKKPRSSNAYEGDTVIIYCEVVGDPQPQVAWLRDFLKVGVILLCNYYTYRFNYFGIRAIIYSGDCAQSYKQKPLTYIHVDT